MSTNTPLPFESKEVGQWHTTWNGHARSFHRSAVQFADVVEWSRVHVRWSAPAAGVPTKTNQIAAMANAMLEKVAPFLVLR